MRLRKLPQNIQRQNLLISFVPIATSYFFIYGQRMIRYGLTMDFGVIRLAKAVVIQRLAIATYHSKR